ncbi:hypothetical protein [Spirillospora sp. CA-128828]|uniref:hypothetical protein n=1 Tax=Spirillospora sp. CA-128828 TaxID=3240033 RepID=UPI003D8C301C
MFGCQAEYRLNAFHNIGSITVGPSRAWDYTKYREALARLDGLLRAAAELVPSLVNNRLAVWLSVGAAELEFASGASAEDALRLIARVRRCHRCEAVITDEAYGSSYRLHRDVEDGGTDCPANNGYSEYGRQYDNGRNWYRGHDPAEQP